MGGFFHAVGTFFDHLAAVGWEAPAIACGFVWFVVLAILVVVAVRRVRAFRERVRQGFAILGDRPRYLREVVSWQALSWAARAASVYWFLRAFHLHASAHNVLLVL